MTRDWRGLTRAAYVVAGHLDAAASPDTPDEDVADASGGPWDEGQEFSRRSRRSRSVRRAPRLGVAAPVARAVGVMLLVLVAGLLLRSCAAPSAQDVPARAADHATVVNPEIAAPSGEGKGGGDGPGAVESSAPDAGPGSGGGTDSATGAAGQAEGGGNAPQPTEVVVHVAGAVANPGLVSVPAGSRVGDAVLAAGGALPGAQLDALNLARPVADGEQVRVLAEGEAPETVPPAMEGSPAAGAEPAASPGAGNQGRGLVDLNTADRAQLETLPGIGPALAGRILDHRAAIGGFTDVAELDDVSGIGPALMARLTPLVTVGR